MLQNRKITVCHIRFEHGGISFAYFSLFSSMIKQKKNNLDSKAAE